MERTAKQPVFADRSGFMSRPHADAVGRCRPRPRDLQARSEEQGKPSEIMASSGSGMLHLLGFDRKTQADMEKPKKPNAAFGLPSLRRVRGWKENRF